MVDFAGHRGPIDLPVLLLKVHSSKTAAMEGNAPTDFMMHCLCAGQSDLLECQCCFCEVAAAEATAMQCGHAFCNDCWRQHCVTQIGDGRARKLPCMGIRCATVCDEDKARFLGARSLCFALHVPNPQTRLESTRACMIASSSCSGGASSAKPYAVKMPHNAFLIKCRASVAHATAFAMVTEQGMVLNLPERPRCTNIQCHGVSDFTWRPPTTATRCQPVNERCCVCRCGC